MVGRLKFNDYDDDAWESAYLLYSSRSIADWDGLNRLGGDG
jgi:hypothetical protein